jgi:hypothetical protein
MMIRFVIGFFLVFGAVGGMDNGSDLFLCTLLAVVGLVLMYFGSTKIAENNS